MRRPADAVVGLELPKMIWLAAWEACVEEPPCCRMLAAALAADRSVELPLRPVPEKLYEAWLPVPVSLPTREEPAAEAQETLGQHEKWAV